MSEMKLKIIFLIDQIVLLVKEITACKEIENKFEQKRFDLWDAKNSGDVDYGDDWPDGFEDEWR